MSNFAKNSRRGLEVTETRTDFEEPQVSPWLKASLADFEGLDFDQVIAGSTAADSQELGDLYRIASRAAESGGDGSNHPARTRAWDFISGAAGMYFKPEDPNEPFGPMLVLTDGSRSAAPADFRTHVDLLQTLASATTNVVLRARLSDLSWLLDREQPSYGVQAVKAYVELVQRIEAGELKFQHSDEGWSFPPGTKDYLLRALGLARMLGWSKREFDAAREQLVAVRRRAATAKEPVPVHWYCELDLQMRVSDPLEIASEIEGVLATLPAGVNHHVVVDLWRLASRAYHAGKKEEDKQRCQVAAAEVMVAEAEKIGSPMLASHLLAGAIAALHGVGGARARRTELRHRLIEVQANVGEEMGTFSQELDLTDLVEAIQSKFKRRSVYDGLFLLAALDQSPDPEELRAIAIEQIRQSPLSSLFGAAHLDDEGKVIHRTDGGDPGEGNDSAISRQIAQFESIRRHASVAGRIDPARRAIVSEHYLSDEIFCALMAQSPFVPEDLVQTFARGFNRFFQGDFTSALYILTPLLENSLRYALKSSGHDVTTFDNAGQTQEDRTITSLFSSMREELDSVFTRSITDEIERVFLAQPGPVIRHSVAHGLLHDGNPYSADAVYACWLIFRLCLLPLFSYRQELGLA
jgi:hypothetical protein